eukprot:CAMPEP_0174897760 /NCGR_PEP_ID=MMETSP0167-20121228/16632_1 /TAXON_ID=38298 /ORGANISM="Rhodella maculata, Strain CCMP736" /LENGTH=47 /DNA_ID= /DNA_START= /DNA_END= /DNA_ORIENTATION=
MRVFSKSASERRLGRVMKTKAASMNVEVARGGPADGPRFVLLNPDFI